MFDGRNPHFIPLVQGTLELIAKQFFRINGYNYLAMKRCIQKLTYIEGPTFSQCQAAQKG